MQYIKWGGVHFAAVQACLDIEENIQKVIKKTQILNPFSIVKFECLDQLWLSITKWGRGQQ